MTTTIDELEERVRQALEQNFQISSFEGSKELPGRIVVRVVSPEFDALDDVERQVRVWEVLRATFCEEELLALEYVFTDSEAEARDAGGEQVDGQLE